MITKNKKIKMIEENCNCFFAAFLRIDNERFWWSCLCDGTLY